MVILTFCLTAGSAIESHGSCSVIFVSQYDRARKTCCKPNRRRLNGVPIREMESEVPGFSRAEMPVRWEARARKEENAQADATCRLVS